MPRTGLCSCVETHQDNITKAREAEIAVDQLLPLAAFFKVLSDPSRLRILNALMASELCVCDLGEALGMSQSAVSHQLAMLRRSRLVRFRRDGKTVYYSLDDDHVHALLATARDHLAELRLPL